MNREPTEMEMRVVAVLRGPGAMCSMSEADALDTARAAIRAMREPTTAMVREGGMGSVCTAEEIAFMWQTMIDEASPEEK